MLLDATRVAFERVERSQNRIATFMSCITKVFGDDGPGILIVTNDPRQMTYVRAALAREEQTRGHRYRFDATHGLSRLAENGRGFRWTGANRNRIVAGRREHLGRSNRPGNGQIDQPKPIGLSQEESPAAGGQ